MNHHLIKSDLLAPYLEQVSNLKEKFEGLRDAEISTDTFSFYTSVSAMASSRIEGEKLEIDSYVKYKMLNVDYLKDLVEKPNDLYNAYLFAQKNKLTKTNFLKAHSLISANLLAKNKRGKYRQVNMLVMEHKTFRIQYEAALWEVVENLMKQFWDEVNQLIKQPLSVEKVFYYVAYIHLVFVDIHPFEDGNGRAGRLLEKWFIAEKLGEKAWFVQSELSFYNHMDDYYKNINRLGVFFEQLDYSKALPFLLMLSKSLEL